MSVESTLVTLTVEEVLAWRESGHVHLTDDVLNPDGTLTIEREVYEGINSILEAYAEVDE